jgi:hypothetical protein
MRPAVVWALFVAACVEEPAPLPLPEGDPALFAARAEPVLEARCADPGCHARRERPFALYAPGRHRADPARLYLDEPLTAEELAANRRAVDAFALAPLAAGEPLAACLVVRKPLAVAAGGAGHEGGEIFMSTDDPGYLALAAYLATVRMGAP